MNLYDTPLPVQRSVWLFVVDHHERGLRILNRGDTPICEGFDVGDTLVFGNLCDRLGEQCPSTAAATLALLLSIELPVEELDQPQDVTEMLGHNRIPGARSIAAWWGPAGHKEGEMLVTVIEPSHGCEGIKVDVL